MNSVSIFTLTKSPSTLVRSSTKCAEKSCNLLSESFLENSRESLFVLSCIHGTDFFQKAICIIDQCGAYQKNIK